MNLRHVTPAELRRHIRAKTFTGPTPGLARGHVQANLVIVPRDLAFDFFLFCQRNPRPCPVLDVTEPGDPEPRRLAPGADLRTDLPRYNVYRDGRLSEERADLLDIWRSDLVSFLLGCSFTFENALLAAGLPVRHIERSCNVPMFRTSIPCRPAGPFHGPLVVSMRPMTMTQAIRAVEICGRFPRSHGAPIHIGDPAAIGIADLQRPDYGDAVPLLPGEVPVFWACGVTPQAVVTQAKLPLVITHKPGHMFVSDWKDVDQEG
jgi:uncharacterized protein YcsI (UPF0317 family)